MSVGIKDHPWVKSFRERFQKDEGNHVDCALDFAHPADALILKTLHYPLSKTFLGNCVKTLFESALDGVIEFHKGVDLSSGVSLIDDFDPNLKLEEALRTCADKLHIPVPYTVVSKAVEGINAQTSGTDEFCYIEVSSMLVRCFTTPELKFVLGHECGHIACGHVIYHSLIKIALTMSRRIPIVGMLLSDLSSLPLDSWNRRSEISADRAGLICCGDLAQAKMALYHLEAGLTDISNISENALNNYVDRSKKFRRDHALGNLREFLISHPITPKRIEALELFANSEKYYRVSGKEIPEGAQLISDEELEKRTEKILSVLGSGDTAA